MSQPAVLRWQRSFGRCVLTGLLGAVGLVVAFVGWVLGMAGDTDGFVLLLVGVVLLVMSEPLARRYRQVTTAGLRWQRTFAVEEHPWRQISLSTRAPAEAEADAPDRILVHHRGGTLTWPDPIHHHDCQHTIRWWQQAQQEFGTGVYRAFPGLFPNMPKPPATRRLHNGGRRVWQAVFAVVCFLGMAAFALFAIGADSTVSQVFGLLTMGLFAAGGWVSLRNATSRVWAHPERIEQRRWFARRTVSYDQIAGSYVLARPRVVGLGFLSAVLILWQIFTSTGDPLGDEVANKQVPTLLLHDGTAVPLLALASRSSARAGKLAVALVDPGPGQPPAPPVSGQQPPYQQPPYQQQPGW